MKQQSFKSFFTSLSPEEKKKLAQDSGISLNYLHHLSSGVRQAGVNSITRLCRADDRITHKMLRPDKF